MAEEAPAQLFLPAPPAADDGTIKLDVGTEEVVSLFDKMGPTIVSPEGVLSRIGNWQEMGDAERMRVLRVLGARNKIRLDALKDAAVEQEAADASKAQEP